MARDKYTNIIKQVNAELKGGQVLPDPEPAKRKQPSNRMKYNQLELQRAQVLKARLKVLAWCKLVHNVRRFADGSVLQYWESYNGDYNCTVYYGVIFNGARLVYFFEWDERRALKICEGWQTYTEKQIKRFEHSAYIAEVVRIYPASAGCHCVELGAVAGKGKQTIIYI